MKTTAPSRLRNDPLLHRVWKQLGQPPGCAVTGGYVRDSLLGRVTGDLDLTIDGDADKAEGPVKRLARAIGVRAHLLGTPPHRIWRIETRELKVELWPLDTLSHEEDILRRDFTCNALRWELPDGPLVDLVGGVGDIEDRLLRAISRTNLEDDPVRLLRAPRFLAQLPSFGLDDRSRSWILELAPQLAKAPRERVGQEIMSLLRAPKAARGLRECLDLGLFGPAAPGTARVDYPWLEDNLDAVKALSRRPHAGETPAPPEAEHRGGAGVPPAGRSFGSADDTARLGFLFRAWGLPSPGQLAHYAWPKPDREYALRAARLLDEALSIVEASAADRREAAWRAGSSFPALIALGSAIEPDRPGWRRWWSQWARNPAALEDPKPLLSGTEVAELTGIEPGPELGAITRSLLRAQVRGEVRTRGGAARWLRDSVSNQRQ